MFGPIGTSLGLVVLVDRNLSLLQVRFHSVTHIPTRAGRVLPLLLPDGRAAATTALMALPLACLAALSLEAVEVEQYPTAASGMVDPEALEVVE